MDWVYEMRLACHGQSEPMELDEAIGDMPPKRILIHVSPTVELADIWFESVVSTLMAQGKVAKVSHRRADLKNNKQLWAISQSQVERSVRGLTPIWVK